MEIKKDCIMYVEELNDCNGLNELNCDCCRFYKKTSYYQKKKYIAEMKVKKLYLTKEKNEKGVDE